MSKVWLDDFETAIRISAQVQGEDATVTLATLLKIIEMMKGKK